mgnify:CR=1 FL=1
MAFTHLSDVDRVFDKTNGGTCWNPPGSWTLHFLKEFKSTLSARGIQHRVVSERNVPESCEWTATYVAKWTWDLALYMSYAEIKIFHNGNLDGEAIYDSTRGGGNMGKFIDAEPKIQELVNELMQFESTSAFRLYFG